MKTRTVVCSVTLLALTMFIGSAALAECPEGKIEVTIVQGKSGRVMTICVSEAAIPHIGGESDVVIPATCPCFTPEEVETAMSDANPGTGCSEYGTHMNADEECGYASVETDAGIWFGASMGTGQMEDGGCDYDKDTYVSWGAGCNVPQTVLVSAICSDYEGEYMDISVEEARACIEILRNAMK